MNTGEKRILDALAAVTEAQRNILIAINTHKEDYREEACLLTVAKEEAVDAGCTKGEIELAIEMA